MGRKRDKQKQIQERKEQRKKDKQTKKKMKKRNAKLDAFKLQQQYIKYFNDFNKQIKPFKITLRDVGGDGNCLFRAFADQIDGNQTSHIFMRQQSCKFIINNADFFKPFLDQDQQGTIQDYVKQMKKDGQWGGHFQLQALSQCFRCIIVIHKKNLQEVYIRPLTKQPQGGIIHLAYFQTQDFEHYLSIRDIQDQSDLPAIEKLRPLNKNLYAHLLYEDQEEYLLRKQIEQLEIIQKYQNKQQQHVQQYQQEQIEPYPNYPRNKKCKCGSKQAYKNCCFKQYQKRRAQKGY